jgi:ribonuclease P protein component
VPGGPAVACAWPSEDGKASFSRVPGTGTKPSAGFGKDKRIRTSVEFEALMRGGTRRTLNGFTFFYSARPAGSARLGILISKKHAALATDRNRIKRCIREAFRLAQVQLGALDVLVRPPYGLKASSGTVARLRSSLERLAK